MWLLGSDGIYLTMKMECIYFLKLGTTSLIVPEHHCSLSFSTVHTTSLI